MTTDLKTKESQATSSTITKSGKQFLNWKKGPDKFADPPLNVINLPDSIERQVRYQRNSWVTTYTTAFVNLVRTFGGNTNLELSFGKEGYAKFLEFLSSKTTMPKVSSKAHKLTAYHVQKLSLQKLKECLQQLSEFDASLIEITPDIIQEYRSVIKERDEQLWYKCGALSARRTFADPEFVRYTSPPVPQRKIENLELRELFDSLDSDSLPIGICISLTLKDSPVLVEEFKIFASLQKITFNLSDEIYEGEDDEIYNVSEYKDKYDCEIEGDDAIELEHLLTTLVKFEPSLSAIVYDALKEYQPSYEPTYQPPASTQIDLLMGLHERAGNKSPVRTAFKESSIFEKRTLGIVFDFLGPTALLEEKSVVPKTPIAPPPIILSRGQKTTPLIQPKPTSQSMTHSDEKKLGQESKTTAELTESKADSAQQLTYPASEQRDLSIPQSTSFSVDLNFNYQPLVDPAEPAPPTYDLWLRRGQWLALGGTIASGVLSSLDYEGILKIPHASIFSVTDIAAIAFLLCYVAATLGRLCIEDPENRNENNGLCVVLI
ncbi:MAG: hypothetical protein QM752_00440 [Gammaproteobacteria bacterium]